MAAATAVIDEMLAQPGAVGFDLNREALEAPPGFQMGERRRLLTLLPEIWYERAFDLEQSSWSPEKGRPFVESDGQSVLIPAVMPSRDEGILGVLHAAGHLVFGSFDDAVFQELFHEAGTPRQASGPIAWAALWERYGDDVLRFELIFDLCEDLRIDSRIQSRVPNYLSRLLATGLRNRPFPPGAWPYFDAALDAVRGALAVIRGTPADLDPRLRSLLEPGATIADAFRVANELYRETELPAVMDQEVFHSAYLPGRAPNAARLGRESNQEEQGLQAQTGASRRNRKSSSGQQGPEEQQLAASFGLQPDEVGETAAFESGNSGSDKRSPGRAQAQSAESGRFYPEWDYRKVRYKQNWTWVIEKPFEESNGAEADRLKTRYAAALKHLKKVIQAQKPTRRAPRARQFDGDDIDLNAAVAYVSERRAGMSPQPAIYRRREIRQRDVAMTLLADMSTSIMQLLPKGGERLVDRVRAGMLLFVEAMEEVGDLYSVAGFRSRCSDNVTYFTIKDFDQPLTAHIKSLIGGISGRLATRMGAAIRHATARFAGIESRRRLLLILSDGRPEDYDDGGDRRYLHEDTRMAVKEAVMRGVHPFCITVDPSANQYLPQIFGHGHYLVLDNIDSLPRKLPEIYLRLRR